MFLGPIKALFLHCFIQMQLFMDGFFAHRLLTWYAGHRRFFPWRDTRNPYMIWISEIILQQTRVSQGYDYFVRFIERFPDVETLAEATEDDVLKCWQGLGYYSRARNLHCAARQIVAAGKFPDDYENIRRLKGVGDYTAAAIASFAFGLPYAVVDGNVYRVLSRYFGITEPIDTTAGKKYFAGFARSLLPEGAEGADYNQAIMDFGALQCVPRSPLCAECPFADSCMAYRMNGVHDLPVKSRTLKVSERYLHYIYIQAEGEAAFFRREGKDIWKGLYEPFLIETGTPYTTTDLFTGDLLPDFVRQEGAEWRVLQENVRHQLTHRTLICNFYRLDLKKKPLSRDFGRDVFWVSREEISRYAVPRLVSVLFERSGLMPSDSGEDREK